MAAETLCQLSRTLYMVRDSVNGITICICRVLWTCEWLDLRRQPSLVSGSLVATDGPPTCHHSPVNASQLSKPR